MKSFSHGISERRPIHEGFAYILLFRNRGPFIFRDLPEEDKLISCCATDQVPGGGRDMEGWIGKGWIMEVPGGWLPYFNANGDPINRNR